MWYGGAIGCSEADATFRNCTFTDNSAGWNSGTIHCFDSISTLTNCIVWGGMPTEIRGAGFSITYCDVQGGYRGAGNLDADPNFRSYRGYAYVLAPDSPCIDSGTGDDDGVDWNSIHPRYGDFNSTLPDMGAYGGPGAAGWRTVGSGLIPPPTDHSSYR